MCFILVRSTAPRTLVRIPYLVRSASGHQPSPHSFKLTPIQVQWFTPSTSSLTELCHDPKCLSKGLASSLRATVSNLLQLIWPHRSVDPSPRGMSGRGWVRFAILASQVRQAHARSAQRCETQLSNLCGFSSCSSPLTTQQVSYQQLQLQHMRSLLCVQTLTRILIAFPAPQPLQWGIRSLTNWQGGSSAAAASQGEP